MLRRKLIRDLRANFGQFFSIFILAALAMAMYVTFEGHVLSENAARDFFHEEAALSDLWVYSEGFPESQLETVRNLPFVESAQLRTSLTGSAPDYGGAQVDICLEDEDVLDHPVCLEGEPFDPTDKEGVWLSQTFADLRGIKVGDSFVMDCKGLRLTKTVRGLCESAEYEFRQAEGDADVYLENITFAYMAYDAFPVREYAVHLVESEKITMESLAGSLAGLAVGHFSLAPLMLDIFSQMYVVPGRTVRFSPVYLVITAVITLICVLASFLASRRILKVRPAEALRPAAPKSGRRILAERLPIWRKLRFETQYNLRDISRGRLRSFMAVAGTSVGMMLMVYGVGCNWLLTDMIDIVFNRTTVAEYQMTIAEDSRLAAVEEVSKETEGELVMTAAAEVALEPEARSANKQKGSLTVLEGKGFCNVLDLKNEVTHIPEGTVGLSRVFAEKLGAGVGDTICWHLYDKNDWYEAKVGGSIWWKC